MAELKRCRDRDSQSECSIIVIDQSEVSICLCHSLRVDEAPEVGDHPHGGRLEYLVLCPQYGGHIDIPRVLVSLQGDVIVEHEVVPEQRGQPELTGDADHDKDWLLVLAPDVRKTTSLATTDHGDVIHNMVILE